MGKLSFIKQVYAYFVLELCKIIHPTFAYPKPYDIFTVSLGKTMVLLRLHFLILNLLTDYYL